MIGRLESATARRPGERGDFCITVKHAGAHGSYRCNITYMLDGKRFAVAGLDVTTHRQLPGNPDRITPPPVVSIADSAPPTALSVYPVANHLADKIGAMYQLYGPNQDTPSTLPHDLSDIVLISRSCTVDANELHTAILAESERRNVTIPRPLTLPTSSWRQTFSRKTDAALLPADAADADAALGVANRFLGPVLDRSAAGKRWDPDAQRWTN